MNEIVNLLNRATGRVCDKFDITIDPSCQDGCNYHARNGKVVLVARDKSFICRGIYEYLRKYCDFNFTWTAQSIDMPAILPDAPLTKVNTPYRHRLYMNMCTFSYSAVWWDWARWEKEIDWMALHGINMPLAFCGQETIWSKVWSEFGLTEKQLESFFTGPAYLAWNRCGNINGFDGPLSMNWMESQALLQKKIIGKMVALDMHPVVPAFSGYVPSQLAELYPSEIIHTSSQWATFDDQYKSRLLSTKSPMFREISERFIKLYESAYGKQKYFQADIFHENNPADISGDIESQLSEYGESIYKGIKDGNPDGIWVFQGWSFYYDDIFWTKKNVKALLSKVPAKEAIVIDLCNERFSGWEKFDSYDDKDWIFSFVHNFGGNDLLNGDLQFFASHTSDMLAQGANPVGFGISPEGIENNEVVYELLSDLAWSEEKIDVEQWLKSYCTTRYHVDNAEIHQAWKLLLKGTYSNNNTNIKHGFQHRPSSQVISHLNNIDTLRKATSILVANAASMGKCSHYVYDTIEVLGQYCGVICDKSLQLAYNMLTTSDTKRGQAIADQVFLLLYEIDSLMGVIPGRSLYQWSNNAVARGVGREEKEYYRKEGRKLLSTWGDATLVDYAARMWSGLIYNYYGARWQAFFSAVVNKEKFDVKKWENNWIESRCEHNQKEFDVVTKIGKTFGLVTKLYNEIKAENILSHSQNIGRWIRNVNPSASVDVSNVLTRAGEYLLRIEQDPGMVMPEVSHARLFANDIPIRECKRVKNNVYQVSCSDRKPGMNYKVEINFEDCDEREVFGNFWMSCEQLSDDDAQKNASC